MSPCTGMPELLVTAFITFFVVIDPVGLAPVFAGLASHAGPGRERRAIALRGVTISAVVLLLFALGGDWLLGALGIGLPAFRIAGGLLLMLLAVEMVMARHTGLSSTTPDEAREAARSGDVAVFPLAIPLIAGPGALTSVLLLMGSAEGDWLLQAGVLGMMLLVLALTLTSLLLTSRIMRVLGLTGTNVITRVFGIITAALAVQFVVDGVLAILERA